MNIDFFDSKDVPQPRANVKIERLEVKPYPDGWRVRLMLDVTPFQERPNLEVRLLTADGREVAELSIIETMHRVMEFTLHVRGVPSPVGDYVLDAELYYDDRATPQDHRQLAFSISPAAPPSTDVKPPATSNG